MTKTIKNNPKVLGLDVSTKTIGWALFDIQTQELLELTHISPVPKPKPENKIQELLEKGEMFRTKLMNYKNLGITKVVIEEPLFTMLDQINCSPKLNNSGMTEKQRIVPAAIKRIMEHKNYQFKFVISTEEDVQELFRDFVVPFNIPLKNVVCMPGLDDAENFEERTQFCLEMAKKYRFRGLTRLHIAAWNKTLNV